jgi:hypothetical protein
MRVALIGLIFDGGMCDDVDTTGGGGYKLLNKYHTITVLMTMMTLGELSITANKFEAMQFLFSLRLSAFPTLVIN